jgi:hypothetical protein
MILSELFKKLLNESDYTQKSLEELHELGEKFLHNNISAKSGTMKKLDKAFDALTSNIEVDEVLACIEFLKKIKNSENFL